MHDGDFELAHSCFTTFKAFLCLQKLSEDREALVLDIASNKKLLRLFREVCTPPLCLGHLCWPASYIPQEEVLYMGM